MTPRCSGIDPEESGAPAEVVPATYSRTDAMGAVAICYGKFTHHTAPSDDGRSCLLDPVDGAAAPQSNGAFAQMPEPAALFGDDEGLGREPPVG